MLTRKFRQSNQEISCYQNQHKLNNVQFSSRAVGSMNPIQKVNKTKIHRLSYVVSNNIEFFIHVERKNEEINEFTNKVEDLKNTVKTTDEKYQQLKRENEREIFI